MSDQPASASGARLSRITPARIAASLRWRASSAVESVISIHWILFTRANVTWSGEEDPSLQVTNCEGRPDLIIDTYQTLHRTIAGATIAARTRHGLECFRIVLEGRVAGVLWTLPRGCRYIDEIGLAVKMPPYGMWLRDGWIDNAYRGQRLFKRALHKIVQDHYPEVRTLWGDCFAGNRSSRNAQYSVGFEDMGIIRCVRIEPLLILRNGALPNPLECVGFKADRRLILQSPAFRRYNRSMMA